MNHGRKTVQHAVWGTLPGIIGSLVIMACASDPPKSPPPPTPDQVRSHGDRTLDKLKQEEKERATQADMPQ